MLTQQQIQELCTAKYGIHWQVALVNDIHALTQAPKLSIQCMVNRWACGRNSPTLGGEVAIRLLTMGVKND